MRSTDLPAGVSKLNPTFGVDPLKYFAISALVPDEVQCPSGATRTTIRSERKTSPSLPFEPAHPDREAAAVMPTPGPLSAKPFSMLIDTRTTFGAYPSSTTVAPPRVSVTCCAPAKTPPQSAAAKHVRHRPSVVRKSSKDIIESLRKLLPTAAPRRPAARVYPPKTRPPSSQRGRARQQSGAHCRPNTPDC